MYNNRKKYFVSHIDSFSINALSFKNIYLNHNVIEI